MVDDVQLHNVQKLVASIYKQAADDLISCIQTSKNERKQNYDRDHARYEVVQIKRFFRQDPFGIVEDPETIITYCERAAESGR